MALIKCPECGRRISDRAISCPGCGQQVNLCQSGPKTKHAPETTKKGSAKKAFVAVALVAAIICGVWGITDSKNSKKIYEHGYRQAQSDYYRSTPVYGKSGAVTKAQSYLRSSAFSHSGLVEQLEYEGFSATEAQYGADNCGADWNQQAVKCAKSYTSHSGFSYEGLLDQLEYEGFTSSQAQYGVDHCGADWNEQAVKTAKSYMRSFPDWSKSELIDQLEYEGFTYSQAKYGADNCGSF